MFSHCWGTKMNTCRHANNVWGRLWARVEGRAPALVEVYSRHPYGPPLPHRRHVLSHANASAGWDPARARGHFPRDGARWLASLATCFCCCPCRSPVYFSPRDDGPRKSRVSLCRPSCPASVSRMSPHNIIICTPVCYFACITRCFCVLVVGQWDRKPSKVKLAASLVRGMACCEKCGSEFFLISVGTAIEISGFGTWERGRDGVFFTRVKARAPGQVVSDFILD